MVGGRATATQFSGRSSSVDDTRLVAPGIDLQKPGDGLVTPESFAEIPWPKVSVVIPTLNEARNLPHVFSKLPPALHEVIIVDGHSVDDTVATARRLRPDVRIIKQSRSGKGNALACGFAAATGDIIAMVDADGSADPGEIPAFVEALMDGAEYAKGTRFAAGGGSSDITRLRKAGNWVLSGMVNVLCGTRYSDLCYGYNAFWRRHVAVFGLDAEAPAPADGTRLWGDGFEVETLINIRVAQAGLAVKEVASYEHSRIHGVSNLNAFSDGLRVLRTILVERFHYSKRRSEYASAAGQPDRQSARELVSRSQLSRCDDPAGAKAPGDPGGTWTQRIDGGLGA
jgi:glycosyltransferase involved in cell wall biosynthesis